MSIIDDVRIKQDWTDDGYVFENKTPKSVPCDDAARENARQENAENAMWQYKRAAARVTDTTQNEWLGLQGLSLNEGMDYYGWFYQCDVELCRDTEGRSYLTDLSWRGRRVIRAALLQDRQSMAAMNERRLYATLERPENVNAVKLDEWRRLYATSRKVKADDLTE